MLNHANQIQLYYLNGFFAFFFFFFSAVGARNALLCCLQKQNKSILEYCASSQMCGTVVFIDPSSSPVTVFIAGLHSLFPR